MESPDCFNLYFQYLIKTLILLFVIEMPNKF